MSKAELSGKMQPGGLIKKTRYAENQIIVTLKEGKAGVKVKGICRKHDISERHILQLEI